MMTVTAAEMYSMPPGTIYSEVDDLYSEGLYRKGETDDTGWWKSELLAQVLADRDGVRRLAIRLCQTFRLVADDDAATFHVYEAEDVATLMAAIGGRSIATR